MQETSKRTRQVGSRLFAAYAAASLVPVVLLGAVLVRGSQREALESGLEHGRAQAAVIEEMAIAPALSGADLDRHLTATGRRRLQGATDLAIFDGSVIGLRLRGFKGRVVFSDDGSTGGALPTSHPAFRAAAAGRTDVAIVKDPDGGAGRVIRVLQPVVAKATGQSTGVLELYLPYGTIAKHVQSQMRRTYVRLAAGLGALYAVLALIAWSTTRRLRRHAAQHEHEALHDALTSLPNRKWFRERAEEAVEGGQRGAVVIVNDTLGHHAGDELLRVVAQRLLAALRTDDTVARLGGDEFGLILPGIPDAAHAPELLARVRVDGTGNAMAVGGQRVGAKPRGRGVPGLGGGAAGGVRLPGEPAHPRDHRDRPGGRRGRRRTVARRGRLRPRPRIPVLPTAALRGAGQPRPARCRRQERP